MKLYTYTLKSHLQYAYLERKRESKREEEKESHLINLIHLLISSNIPKPIVSISLNTSLGYFILILRGTWVAQWFSATFIPGPDSGDLG